MTTSVEKFMTFWKVIDAVRVEAGHETMTYSEARDFWDMCRTPGLTHADIALREQRAEMRHEKIMRDVTGGYNAH